MVNRFRTEVHVLATSLSPDECAWRLRMYLHNQPFRRRPIDGTADYAGFVIWRRRGRNSFVPTAGGRFVPAPDGGTRIEVRFGRVRLAVGLVFLAAILLILWFASLAAGTSPLKQPFVLFAMIGGGAGAALTLYQQWRPSGDRREVLDFLRTTLEAGEIPGARAPAAGGAV